METHDSSGHLVFKNPQVKVRPTNVEEVKSIIEQRKQQGERSEKKLPSAAEASAWLEYDPDKHAREILDAYLRKANVSPARLADPNENIDDIIAEVVKSKHGAGLTEHPMSTVESDSSGSKTFELKQPTKPLSDIQDWGELGKYNPKLVMHEIITDLLDGKLYYADPASPEQTQDASSDGEAIGHGDSPPRALRVLEVFCGDGVWCNQLLLKHPNWTIEGIDRVASPVWGQLARMTDFLSTVSLEDTPISGKGAKNEKAKVEAEAPNTNKPRFAVFPVPSVDRLLVPIQTYDFIRGRDIFATTSEWKLTLDNLHKILKLDGLIELIELDPRPHSLRARGFLELTEGALKVPYGRNAAAIFPEILDDRLKEAIDPDLLQESSPWMNHVLRHLGYSSMPEQIYATELKSRVEASGFCQVREEIIKIPVGDWMEGPKFKATITYKEYDLILGDMMFCAANLLKENKQQNKKTSTAPALVMEVPNSNVSAALSRDELRYKARYIRDIIAPIIASAPDEALTPHLLATLRDIFTALERTPITIFAVEYSRIEKALLEICAEDTKWPEEFVVRAKRQLHIWTAELGDISDLMPLLWLPGGRMHGIEKIQAGQRPRNPGKAERILGLKDYGGQPMWQWSVNLSRTKDPRSFGHHGFEVGDWWIDPICAFRDGIIENNVNRMTAGEQGVYAMVLTKNDAIDTEKGTTLCEWNSDQYEEESDALDARKLLKNAISHEPIRVLRTSMMQSKMAPVVGVRYDGLYRVLRYGLKRDNEQLSLYVELGRDPDQLDISEALKRPRAEERDDWEFYYKVEGNVVVSDDLPS
ncbi:hypothetical protein FGG08_003614 [Glutinoglossum americanum]|uniref:YDG domain-containing protein n=1 Tax=Glutinoglossum americanum TaxID=1670608 RepID=A0A9P8I9C4_9PEZI|nr:hypothetical protein FGG08_003614 [Glutinoglossum americanum]